jgi:2'-5' RNA ligase
MRTFIAIPLPAEARTLLGEIQQKLRSFGADVKWTAASSIHLTLKFLGEIDPAILPRLTDLLRAGASAEQAFPLSIRGLGGFPNLRLPRVIWCGLEGSTDRLVALQRKVDAACVAAGFAPEERPFQPHLTLGRVRGKSNLQPLLDYIKIGSTFESGFSVNGFNVYQSTLQPKGAVYTLLQKIELKGN